MTNRTTAAELADLLHIAYVSYVAGIGQHIAIGAAKREVTDKLIAPYLADYNAKIEVFNAAAKRANVKVRKVKATFSTGHKCNDACMNAVGDTCTCNCGGMNHGIRYGTSMLGIQLREHAAA